MQPFIYTNKYKQDINSQLTKLHRAREAFTASEVLEKICRVLNHNARNSENIKYTTRDNVYFKKANERCWRGPGKESGQDEQLVLVKYGSTYIHLHTCRLALTRTTEATTEDKNKKQQDTQIP